MKTLLIFFCAFAVCSAGFASFGGSVNGGGYNSFGNGIGYENNHFQRNSPGYSSNKNVFANSENSANFITSSSGFNSDFNVGGGGQIKRFVSVHVAPEESISTEPNIIRVGGQPDKHYNIIFVKAPSSGSDQPTEIVLPEQPLQKQLVYILVKKTEPGQNIRIRTPQPTTPSKPEVYFIKYRNPNVSNNGIGGGGPIGGAVPVRNFDGQSTTSGAYGAVPL